MNQSICNICGANYENRNGRWKCPACGAFKPEELTNEEMTLLYIADQKRRLADFDEAERAYTDIIEKYPQNPYGYWGRLLCKHGIKYERDYDGNMIPTCCAPTIESLYTDRDCLRALDLADTDTKQYFKSQAEYIERIRTIWIEKASKEKPYDIFICYKDSDLANGIDRTQDSIEAQDIYLHLISQGYRVFYSRESLRDKIGEKYEPYIFNALSTAKVMIVYGKSSEYLTSTWLKNEWTRYLKMMSQGMKKSNSLIVACDGFSPSELPTTLSSMQCLDASRKTFFPDLDSEIREVIGTTKRKETPYTYTAQTTDSTSVSRERTQFNAFINQLNELDKTRGSTKKPSYLSKLFSGVSDEVDESKARIIKSYRLPDTIEILTEFVLYAASNVDFDTYNLMNQKASSLNNSKKNVARTWVEKIEEAYEKAKRKYPNSNEFYQIESIYKKTRSKIIKQRVKFPAIMVAAFLPIILMCVLVIVLLPNDNPSNDYTSQIETFVVGFAEADFDKFNSPASENGLEGSKIYIRGTLTETEVLTASGTQTILGYLKDEDNNVWLIQMHCIPVVSEDHFKKAVGEDIVVKVVYNGYSGTKKMPATTLDELLILETGDKISGMQKLLYDDGNSSNQSGGNSNNNQGSSSGDSNSNTTSTSSWKNSSVDKTTEITVNENEYLGVKEFAWFLHGDYLECVITITNKSNEYAVEYPSFRITAYDSSNKILGTEESVLSVIYPNQDFTKYCLLFELSSKPNKIAIQCLTSEDYNVSSLNSLDFATHKQMTGTNISVNSEKITGEISNPNNYAIDSAQVTVLFRDANGDIVWGNNGFIDQLPANGTTPFEVYNDYKGTLPSNYTVLAYLW